MSTGTGSDDDLTPAGGAADRGEDTATRITRGVVDGFTEASQAFSNELEGTNRIPELMGRSMAGVIRANARLLDEVATMVRQAAGPAGVSGHDGGPRRTSTTNASPIWSRRGSERTPRGRRRRLRRPDGRARPAKPERPHGGSGRLHPPDEGVQHEDGEHAGAERTARGSPRCAGRSRPNALLDEKSGLTTASPITATIPTTTVRRSSRRTWGMRRSPAESVRSVWRPMSGSRRISHSIVSATAIGARASRKPVYGRRERLLHRLLEEVGGEVLEEPAEVAPPVDGGVEAEHHDVGDQDRAVELDGARGHREPVAAQGRQRPEQERTGALLAERRVRVARRDEVVAQAALDRPARTGGGPGRAAAPWPRAGPGTRRGSVPGRSPLAGAAAAPTDARRSSRRGRSRPSSACRRR